MLEALAVQNYRTLRDFVIPLGACNVITGANGSGKSNVYKALRLLAETAQGGVIASLAREGGLESTLWAGPEAISAAMKRGEAPVQGTRRTKPISLGLGFQSTEFSYSIDLGLPPPSDAPTAFARDPIIKGEYVWAGPKPRPSAMLVERKNGLVRTRDDSGDWQIVQERLSPFDSMLARLADPRRTPELLTLRDDIRSWRFYDHFRTDAAAPARLPQVGTRTPVLGHDGADLAAALQTIREIGDSEALDKAVDDAFPGAEVVVEHHDGRFETTMRQHGLLRPLKAAELSDGTLRYLLWIAALLSPRPSSLLVLNEPETSLHPDLLPALGRLIGRAAQHSQIFVVSHARRLIASLQDMESQTLTLEKSFGETTILEFGDLERPAWQWVGR
ncbi:ATP-binding protein [Roseateles terrae]|uniref:ATPase n=1 Tax=Roseateles terrae TaxID=431060 RepID=A0ABR6GP58_9BURK|nr:putative ATPase [Roseateles terrae]OWQ89034.1 ATP-binding protein [Roseateles terrae]